VVGAGVVGGDVGGVVTGAGLAVVGADLVGGDVGAGATGALVAGTGAAVVDEDAVVVIGLPVGLSTHQTPKESLNPWPVAWPGPVSRA
jgi:hypothetical protein